MVTTYSSNVSQLSPMNRLNNIRNTHSVIPQVGSSFIPNTQQKRAEFNRTRAYFSSRSETKFKADKSLAAYIGIEDPKLVKLLQRTTGDCYLLAAIDAILHHPQAKELLDSFRLEEVKDAQDHVQKYILTFPSTEKVEVEACKVGKRQGLLWPVKAPIGLQILELAYAQIHNSQFKSSGKQKGLKHLIGGYSSEALQSMFGPTLGENVKITSPDQISKFLTGLEEKQKKEIFLLTTTRALIPGGIPHALSIRSIDLKQKTITVFNPWLSRSKVVTYSWEKFLKKFKELDGFRIDKANFYNYFSQADSTFRG